MLFRSKLYQFLLMVTETVYLDILHLVQDFLVEPQIQPHLELLFQDNANVVDILTLDLITLLRVKNLGFMASH